MELGFLLLSDHSESINGKIYSMGAGWNQLRFPELPQEFNFSIALGLDVPWDETNHQHTMTLHIEDPDGERLGDEFSLDFETGRPPGSVAGQEQRIVLSLGAHTAFSANGPHAVIVKVSDEEIGRTRFYVTKMPAEAAPPQQ
jgi:Family of unknown function (DUF6941)